MQEEAIVKGIDRLVVRVKTPEPLFTTLSQELLLPAAWPITTNPFFASGGIHLGNGSIEIMEFGEQQRACRLYGIIFELFSFETSLPLLEERKIPHTPPMPFYYLDEQGWQVTAWNSIYLGGLLSDSARTRLFFTLSQRAPQDTWEQSSLPRFKNRRFGLPFIYNSVYRHGMVSAVEYNPAWRARNIASENTHAGLDVQKIYEVTVGTTNYDQAYPCWKALLDPHPEIAPSVWQLPDGMHVRLIAHKIEGLRRMIWQVASLNRAVQFLHKRDLLGKERGGMPTIDYKRIQGLDIRLVQ